MSEPFSTETSFRHFWLVSFQHDQNISKAADILGDDCDYKDLNLS